MEWFQDAVSWVLVQIVILYSQLGLNVGWTWTLAFVTMALLVTLVLAYPTRRQVEMQRLSWELQPAIKKSYKSYKTDPKKGREVRRTINGKYGFSMAWQLLPTFLSLAIFLALNSVVEGLADDSARGVFTWPQYREYIEQAQQATLAKVPYPIGLQTVGDSPNPWWSAVVILVLLALMIPINATLQRQINGPLASDKWMRRQQRFSLYIQPVVLLMLVVAFNVAVGVMLFQLACDAFSLAIQTWWLRRRPLPVVDTEWLNAIVAEMPEPRGQAELGVNQGHLRAGCRAPGLHHVVVRNADSGTAR